MEKVISLNASKEHYHARATILWCFDDRLHEEGLEKLRKRFELLSYEGKNPFLRTLLLFKPFLRKNKFDNIVVAGAVKSLASPNHENEKEFILDQIRASIVLHKSPEIVLTVHDECGAYRDLHLSKEGYLGELQKAEQIVRQEFPKQKITKLFVDFDGIHFV